MCRLQSKCRAARGLLCSAAAAAAAAVVSVYHHDCSMKYLCVQLS